MLSMLILLASPSLGFTAKWVPLGKDRFGGYADAYDARRDLSLVGVTGDHGADWFTEESLVVMQGRLRQFSPPQPSPLHWIPSAIADPNRIVVERRQDSPGRVDFRSASIRGSRIVIGKQRMNKVRREPLVVPNKEQGEVPFRPDWWKSRFPNPALRAPEEKLSVAWYRGSRGYELGDGHYRYGPPPDVYPFAEGWFPLVRTGASVQPLRELVKDLGDTELDHVLVVSRAGWIVLTGRRGRVDGLVWLYPTRS
jgi:hypothetical protein